MENKKGDLRGIRKPNLVGRELIDSFEKGPNITNDCTFVFWFGYGQTRHVISRNSYNTKG